MRITQFARQHDKMVVLHGTPDCWYASIERVGFPIGFVEYTARGDTPQAAMERLCLAFSGQALRIDGNTARVRDVTAPMLEAS